MARIDSAADDKRIPTALHAIYFLAPVSMQTIAENDPLTMNTYIDGSLNKLTKAAGPITSRPAADFVGNGGDDLKWISEIHTGLSKKRWLGCVNSPLAQWQVHTP